MYAIRSYYEVGGADKFNTGEIEKSMVNMFGHLQGHIQRGVNRNNFV